MLYSHRFTVHAPLAEVAAFHRRSASMADITPPPIRVVVHRAPEWLAEGDQMDFTLKLLGLPVRWQAAFEDVSPNGFVDRQVAGPFAVWQHRHSFTALDAHTTEVRDEVRFAFRRHPVWLPVGLSMVLGLPVLFAYRGRRTRQLLEVPAPRPAAV
jgi:ligand-binding SRPBCC domain-containing protein